MVEARRKAQLFESQIDEAWSNLGMMERGIPACLDLDARAGQRAVRTGAEGLAETGQREKDAGTVHSVWCGPLGTATLLESQPPSATLSCMCLKPHARLWPLRQHRRKWRKGAPRAFRPPALAESRGGSAHECFPGRAG